MVSACSGMNGQASAHAAASSAASSFEIERRSPSHLNIQTSVCSFGCTMQSQLQTSFQRVEQALQRLTDSIAAYNPDVRAAEELEAADAAVNADLKKRAHTKTWTP